MKKLTSKLTATATGTLLLIGIDAIIANAQSFYSPAPTPPPISAIVNTNSSPQKWYITTAVDGTKFYGANPFYYQQTPDGNLFISGVVIMQSQEVVHGSYIQVNCGRGMYRDLMTQLLITSDGYEYTQKPKTYKWQYFRANSAFATVGSQYCQQAIADR